MTEILIRTIEGSTINSWILTTTWLWPFLEIIHFIGLSLLLGSMLVIDIRLAGYIRNMSIMRTHDLFQNSQDETMDCDSDSIGSIDIDSVCEEEIEGPVGEWIDNEEMIW